MSHVRLPVGAVQALVDEGIPWKPITETCQPRPDVLAGLEDRDFAAQLEKVVKGDTAYRSYTEVEQLFDLDLPHQPAAGTDRGDPLGTSPATAAPQSWFFSRSCG
jgi:hypothetical protein